jgi:regulator of protease activity HflC (stomatin/prohibitin superfamily)
LDFKLEFKTIKKLIIGGVIALFAVIILCNCFTVIDPTERGVKVTLGVVDEDILEPGLVAKAPFILKLQKIKFAFKKQLFCNTMKKV